MTQDLHRTKVLLFGTGSIGAVYLYQLQQAGCEVTAVCRSNYNAVKSQGFQLHSVRYGNVVYRPDHIVQDLGELSSHETFDYIVVCTKAFPGSKPSLADTLRPVLTNCPSTTVVLAQNGILIEEEISQEFPENPLLSGVIYCPAYQTKPGVIEYPEMLNLFQLGTYPADASTRHKQAATAFAELMKLGGGGAEVHDDIQIMRWSKLVMNAAWSPICALTLCTDGDFLNTSKPFAGELVWEVMMEVLKLAQAVGYPQVTEEVVQKQFALAKKRSETNTGRGPSMLQDVLQGRPLEVEAVLGNPLRIARQHGLVLPRMETLYALVKARSAALDVAKQDLTKITLEKDIDHRNGDS